MELDERFHLLRPGMVILDLAAAPGSWLQYTAKKIGLKGRAIGIDLQPIKSIAPNVTTLQADITDPQRVSTLLQTLLKKETSPASLTSPTSTTSLFDLVLSDISPSTSGIKDIDQWRSIELNDAVLTIAERWLKPGGRCVLKVFRGADFDDFLHKVKREWTEAKLVNVKASRDRSREVYLVLRKHP
jgi:23S rRNA (uridine2552-2'-O)-methyltransferase